MSQLEMLAQDINPEDVEIDMFRITEGCPRACGHCSQDPRVGTRKITLANFQMYVEALQGVYEVTGNDLFAQYLLTSTDSDPLLHPELPEITKTLYEKTGKRFYLLTSGFYPKYEPVAEALVENPGAIEGVALTLSNFPGNPSREENSEILYNSVRLFAGLPEDQFSISPQYVDGVEEDSPHSRKSVEELLDLTLKKAGLSRKDFDGRIHFRPVIGLGRAINLGVTDIKDYRIETGSPLPVISTREKERPVSGMVDRDGVLRGIRAPRAMLNRPLEEYIPIAKITSSD